MKLFYDLRLGYLVTRPGANTALESLEFKAGDGEEVVVQFGESPDQTTGFAVIEAPSWTAENLAASTTITIGVKEGGDFSDGDLLAGSSSFTHDATAKTYTFELDFNTTAINTALSRGDADDTNDTEKIEGAGFELTFSIGGTAKPRSSIKPITATIYHDILFGDEGTPVNAGDPDEYLLKQDSVVYAYSINSLTGGTSSDLDSIATASVDVGYSVEFFDSDNSDIHRVYELVSGTDAESSPDVIRPDDYAATTNEKVWKLRNASGGGGSGDVAGPASATDNAIPLYDGTTGKLLSNSALTFALDAIQSSATTLELKTNAGTSAYLSLNDLTGSLVSPDAASGWSVEDGLIFADAGTFGIDATSAGLRLGGANARVDTIIDDDTMATASATTLATSESVKAYVDASSGLASADIDTLAELNAIVTDATLIDSGDSRLSDARQCDNTFVNAATSRTNLGLGTAALSATGDFAAALGVDDNYVTDSEKVVIGNTSGTNTGDQDLSTYQLKPSEGAFANGDKTKLDGILQPAIIYEEQTATTDGGTFTSGAWRTRTLNTIDDNDSIVTSLTSNEFILPAGDYLVEWSAPAYATNRHVTRLYDVTNTSAAIVGLSNFAAAAATVENQSNGCGIISPGSATTYRIEHQCQTTAATFGFGVAHDITGVNTIYTQVKITKL